MPTKSRQLAEYAYGDNPGLLDVARSLKARRVHARYGFVEKGQIHLVLSGLGKGRRGRLDTFVVSIGGKPLQRLLDSQPYAMVDFPRDPYLTQSTLVALARAQQLGPDWMRT